MLLLILLGAFSVGYSQKPNLERQVEMIDSAYSSRVDRYIRKCYPDYTIRIQFEKDSFSLCSIEMVLFVAPDISADQIPVLKEFMINMAHYHNLNKEPVLLEYGIISGAVDVLYDRTFKRKEIFVHSLEKNVTHDTVIDLIAAFNKITYSYMDKRQR